MTMKSKSITEMNKGINTSLSPAITLHTHKKRFFLHLLVLRDVYGQSCVQTTAYNCVPLTKIFFFSFHPHCAS